MKPAITVITPNPPICIKHNITIFPNKLHVEKIGNVTSPVTQVADVAVNKASIYGTDSPVAELIGNFNNKLPKRITIIKPSKIYLVVLKDFNLFFI